MPDRGSYVNDLTLIPKPTRPIDIYQPVTSPETIEYVPRAGHKAVYWLQNPDSLVQKWERYEVLRAEAGTPVSRRGEDRCLVLNIHVGRTYEEAVRRGRPGHDEFTKFLAPYGRFSSYRTPDGEKVPFGFQPTLEESNEQKIMTIGSVDDVADTIGFYRDLRRPRTPLRLHRPARTEPRRDRRAVPPDRRGGPPAPGRDGASAARGRHDR